MYIKLLLKIRILKFLCFFRILLRDRDEIS